MGRKPIDLEGKVFGRLTVLYRDYGRKDAVYWYCQCSCTDKTIVSVIASELLRNTPSRQGTKSCGCLLKEVMSKVKKKFNKYDLSGEYGIGWTSPDNKVFYFDLEDYDLIKYFCWCSGTSDYIESTVNRKCVRMHRLVMGVTDSKMVVDHIFHITFDNRKSQLRIVSESSNQMNSILRSNNTSGVKGVYWHKRDNIWQASIQTNYKNIYLGQFSDFDEAVRVRKEAEDKYHGEFSYDNSMKLNTEDQDNLINTTT